MEKIEILFSNNQLIGSRTISWLSSFDVKDMKDVPSHTAVLINETLVIESVFKGVRIIPYKKWKEINNEIAKIPLDAVKKETGEDLRDLLFEMWGKKYDFKGLLYFTWCGIEFILLNREIPKENKWEREDYFFCSEFVGRLVGANYSMTSPARMLRDFLLAMGRQEAKL